MRDLLLIAGITIIAIVIGTLLFFFGPTSLQSDMISSLSTTQQVGTTTVPFTLLEKGTDAISITNQTNYRITSRSDFAALWGLIYGDKNPPPLPGIDFTKYEVLGLFDGSRSTKGFTIALTSVLDGNGIRLITINHQSQQSACAKVPGNISPFELVQVPVTTNILKHKDIFITTDCSNN
jgi:hypothetical protein